MKIRNRVIIYILLLLTGYIIGYIYENTIYKKKFKVNRFSIINAHEHIESFKEALPFLKAMDANGIKKTILLGSPNYTLYLKKSMGFEEYENNNEEILKIANTFPERFDAFVTLNPLDKDNLQRLKNYLKRGARGVKLYYGHGGKHGKGPFHCVPVDYKGMFPVFEYCEKYQIPIMFHINMNKYYSEFLNLMKNFPNLKIIVPHFMLSMWNEKRLKRMQKLFDTYPNLYTDISLGRPKFMIDGLTHISENIERYREFIIKNSNRFFYGTDMVVTRQKITMNNYVFKVLKTYRDFLEKKKYTLFLNGQELNGLNLPPEILKKIYETNYKKLSFKTPDLR